MLFCKFLLLAKSIDEEVGRSWGPTEYLLILLRCLARVKDVITVSVDWCLEQIQILVTSTSSNQEVKSLREDTL